MEGLRQKVEKPAQYEQYVKELRPLLEELGQFLPFLSLVSSPFLPLSLAMPSTNSAYRPTSPGSPSSIYNLALPAHCAD
jgi:hypothetical protein